MNQSHFSAYCGLDCKSDLALAPHYVRFVVVDRASIWRNVVRRTRSAKGDSRSSLRRRPVHSLVCLRFSYWFFQMASLPMVQEMEEQARQSIQILWPLEWESDLAVDPHYNWLFVGGPSG